MAKLLCYQDTKNQQIKLKNPDNLRVMSYNVHGFKNRSNIEQIPGIINAIKQINPDILVIQEVYVYKINETLTQQELMDLLSQLGFEYFAFSETGINAVCSKIPFECQSIDLSIDPIHGLLRNALICKFPQYPNLIFTGTHLDPFDESGKTRLKQIEQIYRGLKISDNPDKQFIIAGDFNSLRRADYNDNEWKEIIATGQRRKIKPIEDVVPWIEDRGFVDSFDQTKKRINVSVWANRRVDYILGLNIKFTYSDVLKTTVSDHYPIFTDIKV